MFWLPFPLVVLPTTFSLELGNEIDHQVSAPFGTRKVTVPS
jgi:hypothetical protein